MTTEPADSEDELDRLAAVLERSGEFRILRRLRTAALPQREGPSKRALFLDTETTGLDGSADTVIELAMLPFDYDAEGCVVAVGEPFVALRDPGIPIPAEVTSLTGISDAMVVGKTIDPERIEAMVREAAIVIAHNAAFDRPFCERLWPIFVSKPWACSLREVDWATEGFEGARLRDIALGFGLFFDGHRAAEDCRAGVEILSRRLPKSGRTGLAALLESARQIRWRLWANGAPYSSRDLLKKRGYRWSPGDGGRPRAWHRDVSEETREEECHFLATRVLHDSGKKIVSVPLTAFERYSVRISRLGETWCSLP
jgi:DNA polymerase-3 subunit epsilon